MAQRRGNYWGWGTRSNRMAWISFIVMLTVGGVLIIAGSVVLAQGVNAMTQTCRCEIQDNSWNCPPGQTQCGQEQQQKARAGLATLLVGILVFAVGFVPLCFFCCCALHPEDSAPAYAVGMQPYPPMDQQVAYAVPMQPGQMQVSYDPTKPYDQQAYVMAPQQAYPQQAYSNPSQVPGGYPQMQ